MRFDPTGQRIAYTLGYGEPAPRTLRIVIADRTGAPLVRFPGGHEPRWLDTGTLAARSLDGGQGDSLAGGYRLRLLGANDGDLSAASGALAYAPDRTGGVRAFRPEPAGTWPGTFEPSLSDGGTLALRDLTSGALRVERLPGCSDTAARVPTLGPGTRVRWSSQSCVWDAIPYGRVYGRVTPNAPTVELTIPGRACSRPVPLWTGVRLFVALVLDEGELVVCDWGSLLRREARGWRVDASAGSAFDWDLAAAREGPCVAFLTPDGRLAVAVVDVTRDPVSLGTSTPPTDPPPPDPPPPPVDPPPPVPPKDPPMTDTPSVRSIPRDQTVAAAIAIDAYLVSNPRLGLPDGLLPTDAGTAPLHVALDATCAYLIGEWVGFVIDAGPLPGDGPGWDARRRAGLDHVFHTIENERGSRPVPEAYGQLHGPIGVVGRDFTTPDGG